MQICAGFLSSTQEPAYRIWGEICVTVKSLSLRRPCSPCQELILETLPDDATWDDVQYAVLFRQSIARGMTDSEAGRGKTTEEVRQHFATKWGA